MTALRENRKPDQRVRGSDPSSLTILPTGAVVSAGQRLAVMWGVRPGDHLSRSGLDAESVNCILDWISGSPNQVRARLFSPCLLSDWPTHVSVLAHHASPTADIGVITLHQVERPIEPETIRLVGDAFSLSHAEREIVSSLCNGQQAAQIAIDRGVAVGTVRSQIKSILRKTPTRGVFEFVKLCWGLSANLDGLFSAQR